MPRGLGVFSDQNLHPNEQKILIVSFRWRDGATWYGDDVEKVGLHKAKSGLLRANAPNFPIPGRIALPNSGGDAEPALRCGRPLRRQSAGGLDARLLDSKNHRADGHEPRYTERRAHASARKPCDLAFW